MECGTANCHTCIMLKSCWISFNLHGGVNTEKWRCPVEHQYFLLLFYTTSDCCTGFIKVVYLNTSGTFQNSMSCVCQPGQTLNSNQQSKHNLQREVLQNVILTMYFTQPWVFNLINVLSPGLSGLKNGWVDGWSVHRYASVVHTCNC